MVLDHEALTCVVAYHHRQCDAITVVQHFIKESGGSTPRLMLTKTNYNEWSLLMKVKIQP
jgi:hypothetical protein